MPFWLTWQISAYQSFDYDVQTEGLREHAVREVRLHNLVGLVPNADSGSWRG